MDDLISVIVPVYKVEKYLNQCVESIVNQTYKNLEIILVDDGSPDNCPQMCDEWAKKDNRIQVFHQVNSGVSSARNVGIREAKGSYILFVDSDDEIIPSYVNNMIASLRKENYDLVVCQELHHEMDGKCHIVKISGKLTGDFWQDFYNLGTLLTGPVVKLYNREILIENSIFFPTWMKRHEDQYFNARYFDFVQKYYFVDEPGYLYWHRNNDSLSQKVITEKDMQGMLAVYEIHKELFSDKKVVKWVDIVNSEIIGVVKSVLNCKNMSYTEKCRLLDMCREKLIFSGSACTWKKRIVLWMLRMKLYYPLIKFC